MRKFLCSLCLAAALALIAAHAWMNFSYLWSQGQNERDGLVLGVTSISIDVMKACLPPLIAIAMATGRPLFAAIGSVTFLCFAAFTFSSALGFGADTRDGARAEREALNAALVLVERELTFAEKKLASIGEQRNAALINSKIAALSSSLRAGRCAVAGARPISALCKELAALARERDVALQRDQVEALVVDLGGKALRLREKGAGRSVDGQVSVIQRLTGWDTGLVQDLKTLLLPTVMELGAGFGLFLALALWPPVPPTEAAQKEAAQSPVGWVGPLVQPASESSEVPLRRNRRGSKMAVP